MSALHAAPPRLSSEERAAEAVYELMRRSLLSRDDYCRRMRDLERVNPAAACYVTWLLLRTMPPSREKAHHWAVMVGRLRAALDDSAR